MLLSKTKEKYEKAFGASERALDSYRRADDDLNLSRAEVEKQRMNSTIKSQQYDEFKNEYANQLQKSNELQNKYYNQSLPNVFHGLQDMDERRIKCIKNFILKAVQVEKEVLPIVSQCLDGMAQCAESIDENEVKTLPLVLKQEIFVSFTEVFFCRIPKLWSKNSSQAFRPLVTFPLRTCPAMTMPPSMGQWALCNSQSIPFWRKRLLFLVPSLAAGSERGPGS